MSGIVVDGIPFYGSFIPPGKKIAKLEPLHPVSYYGRTSSTELTSAARDRDDYRHYARVELAKAAKESGCNAIVSFVENASVSDGFRGFTSQCIAYGSPALLVDED